MKKIALVLVTMLLLTGCTEPVPTGVEVKVQRIKNDMNFLSIVGETEDGLIYQLNDSCFIYESKYNYDTVEAFCMTNIDIE